MYKRKKAAVTMAAIGENNPSFALPKHDKVR